MKRGAAPKFKELGSSPVKQDYHEALDHWKEYRGGKVKKDIHLERKKNFDKFQAQKQKGQEFVKNLKNKGDLASKKPTGVNPGKGWGLSTKVDKVPNASNANTKMEMDWNLENKKAQDQKLAKVNKKSNLSRTTKVFKDTSKKLAKGGKQILKKGGRFLGGKTLGVLGMMMGKTSKADQPNFPKGSTHYRDPEKKINFTSPVKQKKKKEGKIIYKDGKKYWQAPDGSLHTGQISDYETEKQNDHIGKGFMRPPYKDTASGTRPYEKRQGYHGYKNFKSILDK